MVKMRRVLGVVVVAVVLVTAGACASDDDGSTTTEGSTPGTSPGTSAPTVDVVTSDDGNMSVEIPDGALPDGVTVDDITITALGAEDLPGPLAGADVRSAFYALEPHGLEFDEPVLLTRRFDAADSGFDLTRGIPYSTLVTSDPEGETWDVPTDQELSLDGETVVVSGWVEHFSFAFAFNGGVYVGLSQSTITTTVGDPTTVTVAASGPDEARVDARIESVTSDDGITVDFGNDGYEVFINCKEAGTFSYTVEVEVEEGFSGAAAVAEAGLLIPYERAKETVVLTGTVRCLAGEPEGTAPPPSEVDTVTLAGLSACVIHSPLGAFPSYLRWLIQLSGGGAKGAESVALTATNGANGGQPVEAPVSGASARAETGIPSYGTYGVEEMIVRNTNGSTVDLTEAAVALFGEGILVDATETCPPE